jgi:hypothetical protein
MCGAMVVWALLRSLVAMEVMGLNPTSNKKNTQLNQYKPMRGLHVVASHWLNLATFQIMIKPLVCHVICTMSCVTLEMPPINM